MRRFQSTPPHGGEPVPTGWRARGKHVSIHAPARGRTTHYSAMRCKTSVSIHAPARGRTGGRSRPPASDSFQSTPPHGGERDARDWQLYGSLVSIHAPARGRTRCDPTSFWGIVSFNPRPRTGANGARTRILVLKAFVSIHAPARGRTIALAEHASAMGFNPRPRTGANLEIRNIINYRGVSIHAPARGRTSRELS